MGVQGKSLFEMALEAVEAWKRAGDPDFDWDIYWLMLDQLAERMKAAGMAKGVYCWGSYRLNFRFSDKTSPEIDIYEYQVRGLDTLPGYEEYRTRKNVQLAGLLEG